jgi:hypothetical protein
MYGETCESLAGSGLVNMIAATPAPDGNQVACSGRELVILDNGSGTGDNTVTFTSAKDSAGRQGTLEYVVPQGELHQIGPFPIDEWQQTDGYLYIDSDSAEVLIGVTRTN